MRIIRMAALALCLVFSLAASALSEPLGAEVHFTNGEVSQVDVIHSMNSKELRASFVTFEGNTIQLEEIAVMDFPGEPDYMGGFKFVITNRDGEFIPGWINSEKDFGYMWKLSVSGKDSVHKLNQGVQAENVNEIRRIIFQRKPD